MSIMEQNNIEEPLDMKSKESEPVEEKTSECAESAKPEKEDTCSMCGNFCAVKNMNRILDGEIVSIFDE